MAVANDEITGLDGKRITTNNCGHISKPIRSLTESLCQQFSEALLGHNKSFELKSNASIPTR